MAYNITDFYNTAVQRDFARQFQFALVSIGNTNFLSENELVYVETASLPGKTITNVPVPYMGLSFNVPGTVNYPGSANYAITFRCDSNYLIRSQLEEALRILFDDQTSTGDYGIPSAASTMSLALFNKGPVNGVRSIIRTYTMFGVWVQNLQDAAYDIKDTGSVVQIQATIAYQYWRVAGTGGGGGVNATLASVSKPGPFPGLQ